MTQISTCFTLAEALNREGIDKIYLCCFLHIAKLPHTDGCKIYR
jgi:hypothetical protein